MTPQDFLLAREFNRQSSFDSSPLFSGFGAVNDTPNGAQITASIAVTSTGDVPTTEDYIAQSMGADGWQLLGGVHGQYVGNFFAFTVTVKAPTGVPTAFNVDDVKTQIIATFNKLSLPLTNVSVQLTYPDASSGNQDITAQATSFLSSIGSYFGFDKPTSTLGGLGITAAAGGAVVILAVLFLVKD